MAKSSPCTEKGCRERQKGIDKKESDIFRGCLAVFYFICAVLCLVVGGIQATHAVNATSVSSYGEEIFPGLDNVYDFCSVGEIQGFDFTTGIDVDEITAYTEVFSDLAEFTDCSSSGCEGTGWTFVWQFNAAVMIIMGANFLVLTGGAYYGFTALGGAGTICLLNIWMISEYDGDGKFVKDGHTYANEGALIFLYAWIQLSLGICQICCQGCPLFQTKALKQKPKEKGAKRKKGKRHYETSSASLSESEASQLDSSESGPPRKKSKKNRSMRDTNISASINSMGQYPVNSMDQYPVNTPHRWESKMPMQEPAARNGKVVIYPGAMNGRAPIHQQQLQHLQHLQQLQQPQSNYNAYNYEYDMEQQQRRRINNMR